MSFPNLYDNQQIYSTSKESSCLSVIIKVLKGSTIIPRCTYSQTCLQQPPLGPPKKWPFYTGGWCLEVFQSKLVFQLVWPDLVWPLLKGGRYSEVAANTGLTVLKIICPKISRTPIDFKQVYNCAIKVI